MAHSSRAKTEPVQPQIPEFFYDSIMLENNRANDVVRDIISQILNDGAEILHKKELKSKKLNFAARSLTKELLTNIIWAKPTIDSDDISAEPDDDLMMPPIDEWAGGVLPVRDAEATGLRTAVDPTPTPKPTPHSGRRRQNTAAVPKSTPAETTIEVKPPTDSKSATSRTRTGVNTSSRNARKKVKPPPTAADTILRTFEDVRKRANVTTKSVTVDADFTVIQITEPHGLPPSLIVPRIQTKKIAKNEKTGNERSIARSTRTPRATIKKPEAPKKRPPPKIVETDLPRFDNEVSDLTFSERIMLSPGVTFKEGNAVKSRPPQTNTNQLTRAQYEQYLEEMMRTTEQS
ncbi:hypothetical protein TRFO_27609 [Tritrichomonas foetus]|uniref:Uncharacterized protein n=1 Tax=Tritrichomonas foetus TaxID=1144522 RepID=A0A1J4K209_9EUKA|nr:hypothetical protein TRFO_27609 [Tritrichomonas foetus]|eukprot:OHT04824.1 hypothetical protein TRFO_27609 [Tritrichomonas foetus]